MMFPTADEIARAVVAAAHEVGEDPLAISDPAATRPGGSQFYMRHYAYHALLHHYPDADKTALARALCCPGKAMYFHRTTTWYVLGEGPHKRRRAEWWSDEAFARVVAAVKLGGGQPPPKKTQGGKKGGTVDAKQGSAKTHASPSSPPVMTHSSVAPAPKKSPPQMPSALGVRTAAPVIAPRADNADYHYARPSLAGYSAHEEHGLARRADEKRQLYDILAEAARNTAKLPKE